jgi:hypothetical protein
MADFFEMMVINYRHTMLRDDGENTTGFFASQAQKKSYFADSQVKTHNKNPSSLHDVCQEWLSVKKYFAVRLSWPTTKS